MNIKTVRKIEAQVRTKHPGLSPLDFDAEVQDLLIEWERDVDEPPEDTWCMESGRDNCDDWGTGEGQFIGRM